MLDRHRYEEEGRKYVRESITRVIFVRDTQILDT